MPNIPSNQLFYGGDYNPEQWPESIWPEDIRLMCEAGVNLVTVGVFSWAKLQSAPGVFHFEWLDRVLDLLAEHKIAVDLATATASPPPWLVRLHPEMLPVRRDGTVLSAGSRQHYHPSSQAYQNACRELVTALAARYAHHPALKMWHINNEYGCHVAADYGEETAVAFRSWLQARYKDLDAVNTAWGTTVWSQLYSDWWDIAPPRQTPTHVTPGLLLDFQAFSSEAMQACLRIELEILRKYSPDKPVTNNFMGLFKPADYRAWAHDLDFVCHDVYPEPDGSHQPNGMACDYTRSLKNNDPWMVMEQVTTHVNWRARNATKPPGVMRLWSYQAIARGADGICFFQWRQAREGAEKFHGAMVGHGRPETQRCFQESKQLGQELQRMHEIAGSRYHAEMGLLFDQRNWWALEQPCKPNAEHTYVQALESFHAPCLYNNLPIDFVFPDSDLSRYRVLFAPALYLVKAGLAERLEAWVRDGGRLVLTFFSGIVDEQDRVWLGGYPGPFRRLLGLEVEEWAIPAVDDPNASLVATTEGLALGLAASYPFSLWAEVVRPETCKVLATFATGFYAGKPALTRNVFGKGEAWYLATKPSERMYHDLVRQVAQSAGISPPVKLDDLKQVEVAERRTANGMRYLFILNHGTETVRVNDPALCGVELIRGVTVEGSLELKPKDVAIIRS